MMGWCSGTSIFDAMAKVIISKKFQATNTVKVSLLIDLIKALESEDWDCQQDSAYYDRPLVAKAFKTLHPDWFEEDSD